MPLFHRKPKSESAPAEMTPHPPVAMPAAAVPQVPPAESVPTSGVIFKPNGDITVETNTVTEAKLAIKQLKLKKKEWAIAKKEVATEMAQLRAARQLELARQGSMMRGGGKIGKVVREVEHASRDAARRRYANALAPLEQRKALIERQMLKIDNVIALIEARLLQHEQQS